MEDWKNILKDYPEHRVSPKFFLFNFLFTLFCIFLFWSMVLQGVSNFIIGDYWWGALAFSSATVWVYNTWYFSSKIIRKHL